ncbi:MAG: DUF4981 domain-containing protein, partial [Candidatus Bathyarchaeia archaeon]
IINEYDFTNLNALDITWELYEDGSLLEHGQMPRLDVKPKESKVVMVPYKIPQLKPGAEYWLILRFRLAEPTLWAEKGYEIGWEQFKLPFEVPPGPLVRTEGMSPLDLQETMSEVIIIGKNFEVIFNKNAGLISSFKSNGCELIREGPRLNAWRAPTDNDVPRLAVEWRKAELDRLIHEVKYVKSNRISEKHLVVEISSVLKTLENQERFECLYAYNIYGSGDIIIEVKVNPLKDLPPHLPRIELQARIPGEYGIITWYGRGPHENYWDRKEGAAVGVYRSTVDEQYVPYIKPQENGNKTDVRWVSLTNSSGFGLLVVGMPLLEVNALYYTTEDLSNAKHTCDLKKRDFITLNLDYKQSGLGGGSCGPDTLPIYLVKPEPVSFSIRLRPFHPNESAVEISKQRISD